MCGIFGINEKNEPLVDAAAACIRHRGPDSYGKWIGESFSFGFDRLAIIDLDQRANQPMWDDARELAVVFNGEIYNFKELKSELEKEFQFRTTSDTEVLLYGYKKYGPAFAERLRGMFAYAIYDSKKNRVVLFRDHAGIKPLLYYFKDGIFLFGSEMKAVMRALSQKQIAPTLDRDAIQSYFGLGYILSPATMYKHVRKVPRGSYLEFDIAKKQIVAVEHFKSPGAKAKSDDELFTIIEQSILDHLIADVPVGLFFSGGTDSSLIASILHAHKVDLETFSIGVEGRDTDRKYFSEISETLGIKAHAFDFTPAEFNAVYEPVMNKVDEPCADISIFPTYFVSQKAAERVKVVLSGEGGDELFFGYARQRALARLRGARCRASLTLVEQLFLRTPTFKGKNFVFEKIFTLLRQPVSAYLLFMSPSRDLTNPAAWAAAKKSLVEQANEPLYFDRDLYLENDLLRKTDFATSLNSIEGRVPLLDPRIIAAAPAFASEYKPSAPSKPVLKRLLARFLPKELVYRPKSGFGIPLLRMLPHSEALRRDLDLAIAYLQKERLLYATLPRTREELVARYPNLCFAMISLYRALTNNASQA